MEFGWRLPGAAIVSSEQAVVSSKAMIFHLSTTALTNRGDLAHKSSLKSPLKGHHKPMAPEPMAPEAMGMAFV